MRGNRGAAFSVVESTWRAPKKENGTWRIGEQEGPVPKKKYLAVGNRVNRQKFRPEERGERCACKAQRRLKKE